MKTATLECLATLDLPLTHRQLRVAPFAQAGRTGLILVHADTPELQPGMAHFSWPADTLKISAFDLAGQMRWQHDVGRGIIPGLWFCPVLPFDLDGDGDEEVYHISNATPDYPFNKDGMEVTALSSATGEVLRSARLPWFPGNQTMTDTFRYLIQGGDSHGKTRLVVAQGCYHELTIHAWDSELNLLWTRHIPDSEAGCRASHMFPVLDIDHDGRDEVFFGERCIDIDTGADKWVADRDHYHGHSDVVQPTLDRETGQWSLYTCREFPWPAGSRGVVMFDDKGEQRWGHRNMGHMHAGWTARLCDDGTHRCYAVEVMKGKAPGTKHRNHYFYDIHGNPLEIPYPLERTIPVDVDGDGLHELVYANTAPPAWGESELTGRVIDRHGYELAQLKGTWLRPMGKLLNCPGEQILTHDGAQTIRLYGCPDAEDTPAAKARYAHPYYKSAQRLGAVGYNWTNLGGI